MAGCARAKSSGDVLALTRHAPAPKVAIEAGLATISTDSGEAGPTLEE